MGKIDGFCIDWNHLNEIVIVMNNDTAINGRAISYFAIANYIYVNVNAEHFGYYL